ncbi:glycosyl transferase [Fomitopsis serialis]|uniref:glycosyl transferase n=1 Tax=Fomitopsis serialis TaxID=139415 RepID=UPI002007C50A|nr:glycosyl transferase [Neoantrodia serialis]KAH9919333.1 glycosyl transferase [Neoantrodia serialis]
MEGNTRVFSPDDLRLALGLIFTPDVVQPVQIGSFLTALHIEHLESDLNISRQLRRSFVDGTKGNGGGCETDFVVDIVGTGGDGHNTFNVSTTAHRRCRAGARVIKHGSRASTSSSGSATCCNRLDVCSLHPRGHAHAHTRIPLLHPRASLSPALAMIAPYRKALPHRTMFNVLGPLINPAFPKGMVLGVAEPALGPPFAHSLSDGGVQRALVVCGAEGLDEISCAGETHAWELVDGNVTEKTLHPEQFGLAVHPLSAVAGGTPEENAETFKLLLMSGDKIPERLTPVLHFVLMNASALLVVAGVAHDFKDGVQKALKSITSGAAWRALEEFRETGKAAVRQI